MKGLEQLGNIKTFLADNEGSRDALLLAWGSALVVLSMADDEGNEVVSAAATVLCDRIQALLYTDTSTP